MPWVTVSLLCVTLVAAEDQSLRERARATEGGAVSNSMDYEDPVVRTPQLFAMSDLIVYGKVIGAKGVLIENDSLVATVYSIEPRRILKQKPSLTTSDRPGAVPSNLVVRRVGGTLIEGKYSYFTKNSSFPEADAPKVGDEVVWFLIYQPGSGVFNFAAGPFAAFRVSGDHVVPLAEEVKARRGDVPMLLTAFLRDLDRAAGRD